MASPERHDYFTISPDSTPDGKEMTIRLKKWSVNKLLTLLKQIGEIVKLLPANFDLTKGFSPIEIGALLITLGEECTRRLSVLVRESVDDPKLTEKQILEWTLEDFVAIVVQILDMNLTSTLRKNLDNLKEKLSLARPVAQKGAESVANEAVKTATAVA